MATRRTLLTNAIMELFRNTDSLLDIEIFDQMPPLPPFHLTFALRNLIDRKLLRRELTTSVFRYTITEKGVLYLRLLEICKDVN